MTFKKGDTIRNKRSQSDFIVCDVFWHIDCNRNREGWMYHLKRKGSNQFKYVFENNGYEFAPATQEEIQAEQDKANHYSSVMRDYCNGQPMPFTPNIVGQLFS